MKKYLIIVLTLLLGAYSAEAAPKSVEITSPDGKTTMVVDWSKGNAEWSLKHNAEMVVMPSRLSMTTDRGTWGSDIRSASVRRSSVKRDIEAPVYRQAKVHDEYNAAVVEFRGRGCTFAVEVRVFNDGAAYRFLSRTKGEYRVIDELAEFNVGNRKAWVPYVNAKENATSDYATQYYTSFENTYNYVDVEKINPHRLIFAPVVVEAANGAKLCITEADLEDYPGMFLSNGDNDGVLDTEFAPVPDKVVQGDHNMLQGIVVTRKPHIAECRDRRSFPWRVVAIADEDRELAECDIAWRLASDNRLADTSWIKPGKVAWEWWNHWGLYGVDFRAGVNNDTYKHYIDFASELGIEYVILDEGWSVTGAADLMQVVPEIDLPLLIDYARERNVGIILWAGYWALNRDIEGLCRHFAEMGVAGFKIDFMDRDDQPMVRFYYDVAKAAAENHLLVDFHGAYKPTGLSRTYPNVVNYEGVHGLEQMKWSPETVDQITYDVTIPYIRAVAGAMDYTQGAMRNAVGGNYHPSNTEPMSQGTRCHQLALYGVLDSPLNMLCDSPSAYRKEAECAHLIADIPTTWDETHCLGGKIGEYVVMARRKGNVAYIAGLNGHTPREVNLTPLLRSFNEYIGDVEIFCDGRNADICGQDYIRRSYTVEQHDLIPAYLHMASGGGFIVKITLR